ncbi:MAG: RluA family pseudouridine synthase, partial [Actinobacteria bacterium]|nr:RluA family pseudouridine synthase [Actinomycetota bacterium]
MSKALELSVKDVDSGKRLDIFLSENLPGKSRSFVQKLIKEGKVKVGTRIVSKNHRLVAGDKVCLDDLDLNGQEISIKPQKIDLKVVYEDDWLLIVSKKAGIVTHPSSGHTENTLVNAILYYCSRLSLLAGEVRAGIVHRLDKDTSGLIIIAKNDNVHRLLSEEFKSRRVGKTY